VTSTSHHTLLLYWLRWGFHEHFFVGWP
jgi:hypothetical protein